MELQNQFFHYFFIPFLIGVILSAAIVITCSAHFANGLFDTKTGNNIIELGKEHSKFKINSINDIINTLLLKTQLSFTELINGYQKLSMLLNSNKPDLNKVINNDFLKCILDINDTFNENNTQTNCIAYWLLDLERKLSNLKDNTLEKNQLIIISNLMQNFYSTYYSHNSSSLNLYFYFESTELVVFFH